MTAKELHELLMEVDAIDLTSQVVALAELRSVMTSVIEHLYFRQQDHEMRQVR